MRCLESLLKELSIPPIADVLGFHVTQVPLAEHSLIFCLMVVNYLPLLQKVFTIPPTEDAHGFLDIRDRPAAFFKTSPMEEENSLPTQTKACIILPIAEGLGLKEDKILIMCQL